MVWLELMMNIQLNKKQYESTETSCRNVVWNCCILLHMALKDMIFPSELETVPPPSFPLDHMQPVSTHAPTHHAAMHASMVQWYRIHRNSSKFMISRMGKKKYGDAGGETLWLHKSHCSFRHWLGVSKFFLQMMSPITLPGGAWNFAARFLLSAAAGALGLWRFPGLSRPFQGGGGMACLWRLRSQPEWWVYSEICRHGPKTAEMRHSDDKGRPLKTWKTYSSALARWFWMILVYFGGNCSSYLSCLMNFMGKSGQYESQYLKRPILRTWAEVEWWACWREGERGELGGAFLHILCRKDCKGFMLCTAGLWPQDRWMR